MLLAPTQMALAKLKTANSELTLMELAKMSQWILLRTEEEAEAQALTTPGGSFC